MPVRINIRTVILVVLLFLNVFIWYVFSYEKEKDILTVAFLNVGEGDAILIQAPNGNQMLIDGGPNKSVLREIGQVLPFYDRSVDVIVSTHPDKDHIEGLYFVMNRYHVENILRSEVDLLNSFNKSLDGEINKKNINKFSARRGMIVDLGSGAVLEILFPDRSVPDLDTNDASVIGRLAYKDTYFLFTGDAPKKIEDYLVFLNPKSLRSTVLKVGHHGSKTSTSQEFIKAVMSDYAVILSGKGNSYGHPHKEVIDILNENGIKILNTGENGRVVFKSDGEKIRVATQK